MVEKEEVDWRLPLRFDGRDEGESRLENDRWVTVGEGPLLLLSRGL